MAVTDLLADDGTLVFAGWRFDLREVAWYEWLAVLVLAPAPPLALGALTVFAAAEVDADD
jgi:hypothetical protein